MRPSWDHLVFLYRDATEAIEGLPTAERVALVADPSWADEEATWVARPGIVPPLSDRSPQWRPIQQRAVTPGYFEVLELEVLRGRSFTNDDHALEFLRTGRGRRTGSAIVNERAARLLWPERSPVGETLTIGGDTRVNGRIVVGVSRDARDLAPDREPEPTIYVPFAESPNLAVRLLVRHSGSDQTSPSELRARLRLVESQLMVGDVTPLEDRYDDAIAPRRFLTMVLGVFAVFATLLALVGLHGLIGASVSRRRSELAVRVALGAPPLRVRAMILTEAMAVVGMGVIIGCVVSLAAGRVIRSQLYGVELLDPVAWSGALCMLVVVGLAAAWVPAKRGAHRDPAASLRME